MLPGVRQHAVGSSPGGQGHGAGEREEGEGWGGKGEPGCPRLTLRATFVTLSLVLRVREAVPSTEQIAANSSREARRKLYFCWSILGRAGSSQDNLMGLDQAVILGGKGDMRGVMRAVMLPRVWPRPGPQPLHILLWARLRPLLILQPQLPLDQLLLEPGIVRSTIKIYCQKHKIMIPVCNVARC